MQNHLLLKIFVVKFYTDAHSVYFYDEGDLKMKQTKRSLLKKALATVIPLTCVFSVANASSFSVSAAEYSQDGIDTAFSVTANGETDKLNAVLTLSNTNNFDIENVVFDFENPTGYKIVAETIPSKIDVLKNGKPITLSLAYEKEESANTSQNNNSGGNSNNSSSSNNGNSNNNSSNNNSNNNSSNSNTQKTSSAPGTGDNFPWITLSTVLLASGVTVGVCLKKKKGKKFLSLFFAGTMCGTSLFYLKEIPVSAEVEIHSFTIEEVSNDTIFKVNISYSYQSGETNSENNNEKEPDSESYKYYKENSEKIIEIVDASNPDNLLSGAEAVALLKSKGFGEYPVTVYYDINGEYIDETEVDSKSTDYYPMYHTFYVSETDVLWKVMVIGKSVVAVPMSYMMEIDTKAQIMFSESESIVSYNIDDMVFYITIPKKSAVDVNVFDMLNAESLKNITNEEIANYEKN